MAEERRLCVHRADELGLLRVSGPEAVTSSPGGPLVSVLMAAHRADEDLVRAVDSILQQSHRNLELILVDDGSPEGLDVVLKERIRRDPRIRLLRNDRNLGLAASLNRAMGEARGAYCARMDADDVSRPRRIERQVAFMESNPDIAMCGTAIRKWMGGRGRVCRFPVHDAEIRATLLFHTGFAHPTVMWRRADFEREGLRYDESFATTQDYELWSRAFGPLRGANLKDVLLDYFCHEGQVTSARYRLTIERTRVVNARMVRRLIPDAGEEQLALHTRIAIPHDAFSSDELARAEEWLIALDSANQHAKLFEAHALRRVLAAKWTAICDISAPCVPQVKSIWAKSELLRGERLREASIKFRIKRYLGR